MPRRSRHPLLLRRITHGLSNAPLVAPQLAAVLCDHAPAVPTYDYQCRSCGRTTEVIHSMLEEGPKTCEHCGGELRRVLYPTGIIFKGSGFYKTDSRASSSGSGSGSTKLKPSGDKAPATTGEATSSSGGSSTETAPTSAPSPSVQQETVGN